MIKLNGYYLLSPKKTYCDRSKKHIYSFSAYRFLQNGHYEITSKSEFLEHITDFTEIDFKYKKPIKGRYDVIGDKITLFKPNKFSQDITVEIVNENKLAFNFLNRTAYYVSFEKVYSIYGDEKPNEKKIIEKVFDI